MENQEEFLDEEVEASDNIETINEEGEDDNNESSTKKSNQSNFKALYKSNKEKERLLAEKEDELREAQEELNQWRELNPETVEDLNLLKRMEKRELKDFLKENKESSAENHLKEIYEAMKEFKLEHSEENLNKAWKFVKMDIPEESKSKKDFSIWKTAVSKTTDLTKISPEEALNLSRADQAKWREANWWD